ncbi:UNVERIFIED_CONTAM: hypothetical protein FKN15_048812 [Acipenser sinensis]
MGKGEAMASGSYYVDPAGIDPLLVEVDPAGIDHLLVEVDPAGIHPHLGEVDPAGIHPHLGEVDPAGIHLLLVMEKPAGIFPLLVEMGTAGIFPLLVEMGTAGIFPRAQRVDKVLAVMLESAATSFFFLYDGALSTAFHISTFVCKDSAYFCAATYCDEIRKKFTKVTLNPDTASPSLTVSEDGSQVRFKGERSAEWPSVLSMEGFTSGRHYWEVEVGEKGYWALGISTYLDEKIIPEKPEEGYWLLRRWKGNMYEAVSQSLVPLTLQRKLYKVGMILDYQKGELSFYNVYDGNTRYEIHTFNYKFTEVYPVFSPGSHERGPLKITRFKSGDGNPNL